MSISVGEDHAGRMEEPTPKKSAMVNQTTAEATLSAYDTHRNRVLVNASMHTLCREAHSFFLTSYSKRLEAISQREMISFLAFITPVEVSLFIPRA